MMRWVLVLYNELIDFSIVRNGVEGSILELELKLWKLSNGFSLD